MKEPELALEKLASYIYDGNMHGVAGWLWDGAAYSTAMLGLHQSAIGITGDVAEIGVHHGKYFLVLSLLRRAGEAAVAIDVFDDQDLNPDGSGRGDRDKFLQNFMTYDGRFDNLLVLQQDSLLIRPTDLTSTPGKPSVRLMSVDGSHTAEHTRSDLEIAEQTITDDGVVILDDFYNAHWPGVQEGAHRYLDRTDALVPFAYGVNKLLCRPNRHADYFSFFEESVSRISSYAQNTEMHGRPVYYFEVENPRNRVNRRFQIAGANSHEANSSGDVSYLSGWSIPEPEGIWMIRATAVAEYSLPTIPEDVDTINIAISVTPFLHPGRPERTVTITIDDEFQVAKTLAAPGGVSLTIPRNKIGDNLLIRFETEEPESPRTVIEGSKEARKLALFVSSIRIQYS